LVVIIDEAETILRMRRDVRGKSLNGIRQIIDDSAQYHGLLWIFTGTPEFFDVKRGVAGLQPLHDRIGFIEGGDGRVSLRQSQLALKPFDKERLKKVALKLREIYPTSDRASLEAKVSVDYITQLVDKVSVGFKGDVGVVPRQFLRQLVNEFDLVNESIEAGSIIPLPPTEDEQRVMEGKPAFDPEPEDEAGYEPATVEF
jgi:hypothetical protein